MDCGGVDLDCTYSSIPYIVVCAQALRLGAVASGVVPRGTVITVTFRLSTRRQARCTPSPSLSDLSWAWPPQKDSRTGTQTKSGDVCDEITTMLQKLLHSFIFMH